VDYRAALLANVLNDPADDTARLVFADWLQENGQEDRAEFIRLGVRLDDLLKLAAGSPGKGDAEIDRTRKRLRALLKANFSSWGLEVPGLWIPRGFKRGDEIHLASPDRVHLARVRLTRGFVWHVETTRGRFLRKGFARQLFSAHPVTSVSLTGCAPLRVNGLLTWYKHLALNRRTNYHHIGEKLWSSLRGWSPVSGYKLLRGYKSRADALVALSEACARWGRGEAGRSTVTE
jgi:uncharacterized protein (TIGR02996 family)